jgi:hypothetical protein
MPADDGIRIGALLVMSDGEMVGIISERDCIRKVDVMGRNARDKGQKL